MIAWVAARNDAPELRRGRAYQFPSDTTIFGPAQIEARIDQDPTISAQISLWNQSGSEVIRGNLIVVPVGDSLLYLQPVYLQSTSSAFPEFQKIVVASPTTVVWGDTLAEALNRCSSPRAAEPGASPTPGPTPTPGPSATPGPDGDAGPDAAARTAALPTDVDGPDRLREHALRAGPGGAPGRRLRDLRRRDGQGPGARSQRLGRAHRVAGRQPSQP